MEAPWRHPLSLVACIGAVLPVLSASAATDSARAVAPVRVIAKIATGAGPCIASPARGRVWVSNFNAWTLARVNPRTNRVVGLPLRVGKQPCGLAHGDGSLWVGPFGTRTVERVNPATGKVVKRIVIGGTPYDVAFHDGSLWATSASAGAVVRIDPRTNRVVARIVTGGTPANLTVAFGSLWAGSATGTTVFRIETDDNALTRLETGGEGPTSVEPVGEALWVSHQGSNTVAKLDPATGEQLALVPVGRAPAWLGNAGDGTLLVPNARSDTVSRIDRHERGDPDDPGRGRAGRVQARVRRPLAHALPRDALAPACRLTPIRLRQRPSPRALAGSGARRPARAPSRAG